MKEGSLEREISRSRERLEALAAAVNESAPADRPLLERVIADFSEMLQELEVAGEELRQQNEELFAMQEAVEKEQRLYRELFEFAPDGYVVTDPHGIIAQANQAAGALLKVSPRSIIGKPIASYVADEDKHSFRTFHGRMPGVAHMARWEGRFRCGEGCAFPAAVAAASVYDKDGQLTGVRWLLRDVTERKKAEERILEYQEQLRALASDITLSEERERHRIAVELHDGLGQNLAVSKMKLSEALQMEDRLELVKRLDELRSLLDESIKSARTLISEIGSPVLYEVGLTAAIEQLAEDSTMKYGLNVRVEDDGQPKPLADDAKVILFQGVKELLVNAMKHAGTPNVTISIARAGESIMVAIRDEGRGFDMEEAREKGLTGSSLGLFGVRERLMHSGGRLEMTSEPGKGTSAVMTMPLVRGGTGG